MAQPELKTDQEVIQRFGEMRNQVNAIWSKLNEIQLESQEHELVIKALEPMDAKRKTFRLIGEVLVERDVAETLPAVQRHKANLDQLISTLKAQFEAKKKELGEFQTKYKIRVQGQDDDDDEGDRKAGPSSNSSGAGVLVANK